MMKKGERTKEKITKETEKRMNVTQGNPPGKK